MFCTFEKYLDMEVHEDSYNNTTVIPIKHSPLKFQPIHRIKGYNMFGVFTSADNEFGNFNLHNFYLCLL